VSVKGGEKHGEKSPQGITYSEKVGGKRVRPRTLGKNQVQTPGGAFGQSWGRKKTRFRPKTTKRKLTGGGVHGVRLLDFQKSRTTRKTTIGSGGPKQGGRP